MTRHLRIRVSSCILACMTTIPVSFAARSAPPQNRAWIDSGVTGADATISVFKGNPNGAGLKEWKAFNASVEQTMELGTTCDAIPLTDQERMNFMKRFFATQKSW